MPYYAYKRKNGIYHIRGKHHGRSVDKSARTRVKSVADAIIEKLEREAYDEEVLGKKPDRTFAEAAIGYMESGGERALLKKILATPVQVEKSRAAFGVVSLKDIDQSIINQVAAHLYPEAKNSTRNRNVFTPIASVLNYASEQPSWDYRGFRIRRPKQPPGRVDWRTPQEIEWWIERCGHVAPLFIAYVGSGARASEQVWLDWEDVSPAGHSFTLWEEDTKSGKARTIDLQSRVRSALPPRGHGRVWRNSQGAPWHDYDAVNLHLYKVTERETERAADAEDRAAIKTLRSAGRSWKRTPDERSDARRALRAKIEEVRRRHRIPRIHLHVLRHTWATWAYAVTRDITFVMDQGGWASEKLALRYIHGGRPDLAAQVKDFGWEMQVGHLGERRETLRPVENTEGKTNASSG